MAVEIVAGFGLFKSMLDIVKGLKDISDAVARNAIAIELQEKILAAQEQQSALIERIRELEKEVTSFETWEAEKQKYDLEKIGQGQFARALKPVVEPRGEKHYVCANCFEQKQISVLQPEFRPVGRARVLVCFRCGAEIYIEGSWHKEHGPRMTHKLR